MTAHLVGLNLNGAGLGRLSIDGRRVPGVRRVSLDAGAGQRPQLVVDLLLHPFDFYGEADVAVSTSVVEVLKRLGWTPPGGARLSEAAALDQANQLCDLVLRDLASHFADGDYWMASAGEWVATSPDRPRKRDAKAYERGRRDGAANAARALLSLIEMNAPPADPIA